MDSEPLVFVGIDWASTEHQVCLTSTDDPVQRAFAHDAAGIGAMVDWLCAQARQPGQIAVGIETPHGPVVEALMDRGVAVFAINPKQLDRFRDRFSPAGAKDDRRDALVLASSLRTDRHCFRRVEAMDPLVVELREWSCMAAELKDERIRLANRVRQQLWRYYPQVPDLADDVGTAWVLTLWSKAPTPADASRMTEKRVARILAAHRIRRITAADALAILQRPALTVAPGTAEAARAHIAATAERLHLVNRQIKNVTHRLDALVEQLAGPEPEPGQPAEQRDATILRSLPGVGRIVLATLLAEAHQAIQARDYHALRTLTGVAPVTKRSGKSRRVEMRQACSNRLRTAVYHWARVATQHDARSKSRYAALRARGHSHGRALRTVADRLLSIACVMLEKRSSYDPQHEPTHAPKTA
ncbi:IS110 family transposase [Falsiroseomonas sp. E2-1-a4]|uniref:IS110 family transposase n=1 Tax=Falsiroseomonas sp. E2-1-a4 TaxID=3239299 RepID=UPI003F304B21